MNDDHYRALFTSMQEAVLVAELIDLPGQPVDFRYVDVNPAAERILGLARDQIIGHTGRELIPHIQEDLVDLCARVVRTGVSESRDIYEPALNQHHQTVFFRPSPGLVALVFTDVTARRQSEEQLEALAASLERERRRLHLLVSSIDDHLASYDREWRFTFVNDAAAATLGLPREQLLGRSIWELFPEAVGNQYYRDLHTALREDRVVRSEHYYAPFGRWFENHIYPSADGVTVFASDITARKRAEAALRESEARFRVMADGLALLVWVHDAEGAAEFVNARTREFFGLPPDAPHGMPWGAYLHPDDRDRFVGAFRAALDERRPFQEIARVRRADGQWRWIESWGSPRFAGSGEYTGMVGASADVTDRLMVEQALRDADRRKDEFLATLAHELRNPLAAIRSAVDVLRGVVPDLGTAVTAFQVLERQVAHMVRQVDDLFDVSRISRGTVELRREPTDLVEVVQQTADAIRVRSKVARVDVRTPGHPVYVDGDTTRLAQVVGNLLSNALKFSAAPAEIDVTLGQESSFAVLQVRDRGIGIPPDQIDRIFDMFTQLEPASDGRRGGLGVGLSLVKALVEQHEGTVHVRSDGPGRGTEFTVRLPLAERPVPSALVDGQASTSAQRRRVLVVDDNRDAADMLTLLLGLQGHDVRAAYDGLEAITQVPLFEPDLVVLDIGMPGLDGYETARRLRDRDAGLRLVALTGWGEPSDRRRAIDAGFDAHLVKPADVAQIDALLAAWATPSR